MRNSFIVSRISGAILLRKTAASTRRNVGMGHRCGGGKGYEGHISFRRAQRTVRPVRFRREDVVTWLIRIRGDIASLLLPMMRPEREDMGRRGREFRIRKFKPISVIRKNEPILRGVIDSIQTANALDPGLLPVHVGGRAATETEICRNWVSFEFQSPFCKTSGDKIACVTAVFADVAKNQKCGAPHCLISLRRASVWF
jgi:hypothetical protein